MLSPSKIVARRGPGLRTRAPWAPHSWTQTFKYPGSSWSSSEQICFIFSCNEIANWSLFGFFVTCLSPRWQKFSFSDKPRSPTPRSSPLESNNIIRVNVWGLCLKWSTVWQQFWGFWVRIPLAVSFSEFHQPLKNQLRNQIYSKAIEQHLNFVLWTSPN